MRAFRVPLRIPFRGLTHREGLLLGGPGRWGEFSPFDDYAPALTARWLRAARESASGRWPQPLRSRVPVNVTVPAVEPERARTLVLRSGCSTAKVKVGDAGAIDRVAAVRDALGNAGRVRVDVNGSWDVDTAIHRIRDLARFDLEYVEQPVATIDEMKQVRRCVDVPLAVDESVRHAPDPRRVDVTEAADVVVLKVHPLGGVRSALEVADALKLPAVVSSALETSVGLAAGVALAAALPELPYACGLGTALLLDGDIVDDPLVPVDGFVDVRVPAIDEERLRAHALDGDREKGWIARLERAEDDA